MRLRRIAPSTIATLLGVMLTATASSSAFAQPGLKPGTTSVRGRAFADGLAFCSVTSGYSFDRTCVGHGTRVELRADVGADRRLHAEASMIDGRFGSTDTPSAFAEATYAERLTFTGPVIPDFLRFTMFLHGSVGGSEHSYGALSLWHDSSEPRLSISIEGTEQGGPLPAGTGPVVPVPTARLERRTIFLPVVNGMVDFALSLQSFVRLPVAEDDGEVYCPEGMCPVRAARAAFFQTAGVELLEGFDANGEAITSGLQLATASGAQYTLVGGGPVGTVPEPDSWWLVGAGLGATIFTARRRRIATADR